MKFVLDMEGVMKILGAFWKSPPTFRTSVFVSAPLWSYIFCGLRVLCSMYFRNIAHHIREWPNFSKNYQRRLWSTPSHDMCKMAGKSGNRWIDANRAPNSYTCGIKFFRIVKFKWAKFPDRCHLKKKKFRIEEKIWLVAGSMSSEKKYTGLRRKSHCFSAGDHFLAGSAILGVFCSGYFPGSICPDDWTQG